MTTESFTVCTHCYDQFCRQRRIQTTFLTWVWFAILPSALQVTHWRHGPVHLEVSAETAELQQSPAPLLHQPFPLSVPTCLQLKPQKDVVAGGMACTDCSCLWVGLHPCSPVTASWIEGVYWDYWGNVKKEGKKSQACCLCASLCVWHSGSWLAVWSSSTDCRSVGRMRKRAGFLKWTKITFCKAEVTEHHSAPRLGGWSGSELKDKLAAC